MNDTPSTPPTPPLGRGRLVVWFVVGALGVYLVVSGVLGIIAKG